MLELGTLLTAVAVFVEAGDGLEFALTADDEVGHL